MLEVTLVAWTLVGCLGPSDVHDVLVINHGDAVWLLRITEVDADGGLVMHVDRIEPGADGAAGWWPRVAADGGLIEVLRPGCGVVHAFKPTGPGTFRIPDAISLEVIVASGSSFVGSNAPQITPVELCGGTVYR